MFSHYRTQGFILKKINRGEADQLLTIYTKDFGKLKILGRAIRKITSKLRSGADIFYLSEIEFIQGKTYKTLTDASVIKNFKDIKKDLKKLKIAHKIAKLLNVFLRGEEKDDKLWDLLNEVFNKLNNLQFTISNLRLLCYYFLWNFLSTLGYEPEIYKCVVCRKKLNPNFLYFSPSDGGVVCASCKQKNRRINSDLVKILRIILKKNWQILSRLKIGPFSRKLLNDISKDYYSYLLSHLSFKKDEK